ncbi:hypothetical protein RB594_006874 [Gaeumannomyces avenae]
MPKKMGANKSVVQDADESVVQDADESVVQDADESVVQDADKSAVQDADSSGKDPDRPDASLSEIASEALSLTKARANTVTEQEQPAAARKKATIREDLAPAEDGRAIRRRLLYATWVDQDKRPCGVDGTPDEQTDTRDAEKIVKHEYNHETGEMRVLVKWKRAASRANSWVLEDVMHRHRLDMLVAYWRAHPSGSREAALKGTGRENDVFALMYPPVVRRTGGKEGNGGKGGKWELAVEVEYCGYEETYEVAADLLWKDMKPLMREYWGQLGGRPRKLY